MKSFLIGLIAILGVLGILWVFHLPGVSETFGWIVIILFALWACIVLGNIIRGKN